MVAWTYIKLTFIGLISGTLAGLIGGGAFAIIIPGLIALNIITNYKLAVGTSLAAILLPVGAFATYTYYINGYVNVLYSIYLAITIAIGAYIASTVGIYINNKIIKKVYAVFLIALGLIMIFDKNFHKHDYTLKK